MKKRLELLMVMCITAALLIGCGSTQSGSAAKAENAAATSAEAADESDDAVDLETLVREVQATLTYMGGLYVNGNPENDMELGIFKNENGELLYVIYELGYYDYGLYTTEGAETDDGIEYTKIPVSLERSYGYHFSSEDLSEGILVSASGEVNKAIALDESVARDLVRTMIVGNESAEADAAADNP